MPPISRTGLRTGISTFACAAVLSGPLLALEPTPPEPDETPPEVTEQQVPPATRIIVKYVEDQKGRAASLPEAIATARILSEEVGLPLAHIETLSNGAQVLELALVLPENGEGVEETIAQVVEELNANPLVEYAEPDDFMQIQQSNDPRWGEQWHYHDTASGISLPQGWANSDGQGAVVAVIDTGYRPHADLNARILPGYDFISNTQVANDGTGRDADPLDPGDWIASADTWCPLSPRNSSWHGTHVAGTVAAVTDNSLGIAGVAPGARIVPVRVLGKCGGNLSDIAEAIRWSAGLPVPGVPANPNPADVINMSLGGGGSCGGTYQDAIDAAVAAGATVVVAAGNSNMDASNFRPANCNNVVTVAATNPDGARSYFSNFGSTVEIAAPGGETHQQSSRGVLSTLNAGAQGPGADSYAFYQGTSMAAPHVAGVAALLYGADPSITPAEVATVLRDTAKPFPSVTGNPCSTSNCGAGIVDAGAATAALAPPPVQSASIPWIRILLKN